MRCQLYGSAFERWYFEACLPLIIIREFFTVPVNTAHDLRKMNRRLLLQSQQHHAQECAMAFCNQNILLRLAPASHRTTWIFDRPFFASTNGRFILPSASQCPETSPRTRHVGLLPCLMIRWAATTPTCRVHGENKATYNTTVGITESRRHGILALKLSVTMSPEESHLQASDARIAEDRGIEQLGTQRQSFKVERNNSITALRLCSSSTLWCPEEMPYRKSLSAQSKRSYVLSEPWSS